MLTAWPVQSLSILAFAGSEPPEIPSNAFLMIHNPWSYCEGNAADMRKMADDLDQIRTGILNIYAEHLKEGVTIDQIEALMDAESWLNGEKAAEYFEVKTTEAKEYAAAVGDYMKKARCKFPEKLKVAKDRTRSGAAGGRGSSREKKTGDPRSCCQSNYGRRIKHEVRRSCKNERQRLKSPPERPEHTGAGSNRKRSLTRFWKKQPRSPVFWTT